MAQTSMATAEPGNSVFEAQLPLAPREYREGLAPSRLATESVAYGLPARSTCGQTWPTVHLRDDPPVARQRLLKDNVLPGVQTHESILGCSGVNTRRWPRRTHYSSRPGSVGWSVGYTPTAKP
jgi:hypothetical protein